MTRLPSLLAAAGVAAAVTFAVAQAPGRVAVPAPIDAASTRSTDDGPRPTAATSTTTPGFDDEVDRVDDADVSGPCDEAEHATDPRCTGATTGTTLVDRDDDGHHGDDRDDDAGDDTSGPCDEAEHASDPRCTGAVTGSSGPGPGPASGSVEDRSGPSENSGPSGDDDDDDEDDDDDDGDDEDDEDDDDDDGDSGSGSSGSGRH